jgi:hypothetical protein
MDPVRLFTRTNSIRHALAAQDAEAAAVDLRAGPRASLSPDFTNAHENLDAVEARLAELREKQEVMLGTKSSSRNGSVRHIDLRTMIELDESNDAFNRRFDRFASIDRHDRARRWIEAQ